MRLFFYINICLFALSLSVFRYVARFLNVRNPLKIITDSKNIFINLASSPLTNVIFINAAIIAATNIIRKPASINFKFEQGSPSMKVAIAIKILMEKQKILAIIMPITGIKPSMVSAISSVTPMYRAIVANGTETMFANRKYVEKLLK